MSTKPSHQKLKLLGWGAAALIINLLLLFPLPIRLASLDFEGIAFAQTGPPDDTATPIPTATSSSSSSSASTPAPTATATFTPLPTIVFTSDPSNLQLETPTATATSISINSGSDSSVETSTPTPENLASQPSLITNNPPPGIAPLTNPGEIYRIPTNPDGTAYQLPLNLTDDNYGVTLAVSSSPNSDKVIRVEDVSTESTLPHPVPEGIQVLAVFNLDVYLIHDLLGATDLHDHSPALIFSTTSFDNSSDAPLVLLRYNPESQQYETPPQEYDPVARVLRVTLPKTSLFVLGLDLRPPTTDVALAAPSVTSLEESELTQSSTQLFWPILLMLIGLVAFVVIGMWHGGWELILNYLYSTPAVKTVSDGSKVNGLILAFSLPPAEQEAVIQADLAALPSGASSTAAPTAEPAWDGMLFPSIDATASLHSTNFDGSTAVSISKDIGLVGLNQLDAPYQRRAQTVFAGHLIWRDGDPFDRLADLHADHLLIVTHQGVLRFRYVIDDIQFYSAEQVDVVDISQITPDAQLTLIIWGDAFDIDQHEYRDYLVIHSHFVGEVSQQSMPQTELVTRPL